MKITKATILLTGGPDKIIFGTDLPCPFVPEYLPTQPSLELEFQTTYDAGIEYCKKHFGIDPEVINVRRKE